MSTALVLGGGGSAGNAWLIGVVAGLLDSGIDVTRADLIIGTSAGATAAAQLTAADPRQLYADILSAPVPPARQTRPAGPPPVDHFRRTSDIIAAATDPADLRRRLGASAMQFDDGTFSAPWRQTVASRLPGSEWPARRLLLTAVDAHTGQPVEFDRDSGIELVDAVAASTASGPPYAIGDRRYLDGGYRRSSENADLALGVDQVLVLSPLGGRTRLPLEWRQQLSAQVEELEAAGSQVETILPDDTALAAFGDNMMNLAARVPAAKAGYLQGRREAHDLTIFSA